jgi:hypothetical protein
MWPADVYVVYDQKRDRIYSVHSQFGFANGKLKKITNGVVDDPNTIPRFKVATLEQAQAWLSLPFNNYKDEDSD